MNSVAVGDPRRVNVACRIAVPWKTVLPMKCCDHRDRECLWRMGQKASKNKLSGIPERQSPGEDFRNVREQQNVLLQPAIRYTPFGAMLPESREAEVIGAVTIAICRGKF